MGCCQKDPSKADAPKTEGEGCCGGAAMKKESCCMGSKIKGFFKMLLGKKCCGSTDCKT